MLSLPAMAARLESWRFDTNKNRLEINTSSPVQPQAQLIFNPIRLVIDLPGTTFGRPQLTQQVGGAIRALRIGQFDEQTTRLVVELVPGYTLNPNLVKFTDNTGSRWLVQLPQIIAEALPSSGNVGEQATQTPAFIPPQSSFTPAATPSNTYNMVTTSPVTLPNKEVAISPIGRVTQIDNLRVTGDGFFIRTSGGKPQIQVNRSADYRTINLEITGAALSSNLRQRDLLINRYGVKRIQLTQVSSRTPTVRMTLQVDSNSADWRVISSGNNGFVLLSNRFTRLPDSQPSTEILSNSPATIQAVELAVNGTQLLIKANQSVSATGG
jgi:N-acetylmuramoyl-L-alanine amidase